MDTWDPFNSGRLSMDSDDDNLDDIRQVASFKIVGPNPIQQYRITVPQKPPITKPQTSSIVQKRKSSKQLNVRANVKKITVPVAADYKTWPQHKIMNELRQRNISTVGRKEALVIRLINNDKIRAIKNSSRIKGKNATESSKNTSRTKNSNNVKILENITISSDQHKNSFGQQVEDYIELHSDNSNETLVLENIVQGNDDSEDDSDQTPQGLHYLDITSESNIPILSEADLKHFAVLMERDDILVAAEMYKDGYLLTCRIASDCGENYFVTGLCSSDNKKRTYRVTIKLIDHIIFETDCECADTGPFAQCIHVLVVMYGIIDFTKLKTINASVSFRKFNPIKAEDLVLRAKDANLKNLAKFDPRPVERQSRKQYVKYFKNLVANYCGTHNCTMPIMQIVKSTDVNVRKNQDGNGLKLCAETGILKF